MFRKIAAVLMSLMALSLCLCAGAEGVPEDGLYTIGLSSSSDMFRVVKCVLRVEDGQMRTIGEIDEGILLRAIAEGHGNDEIGALLSFDRHA